MYKYSNLNYGKISDEINANKFKTLIHKSFLFSKHIPKDFNLVTSLFINNLE